MNIIHLGKRSAPSLLAAIALSVLSSAAQAQNPDIPVPGPAFLPNPSGSTVVAGWLATDRVHVWDPALNGGTGGYALDYAGPWGTSTATPFAASYAANGNYSIAVSGMAANWMGDSSIYTGNAINVGLSLQASSYSGPAFSKLILQLTPNYSGSADTRDSLNALAPSLNIGGFTYDKDDAAFTRVRDYTDGLPNDISRYRGNFSGLSLVTIEWDLAALGYTGATDNFTINWGFPTAHTNIYDAQLSVVSIPEPGSIALLAVAGAGAFLLRRRKNA